MEPEGGLHAVLPPTTGSSDRVPAPGRRTHAGVGDAAEAARELCLTRTMEPVRVVPDLPADYPVAGMVASYHSAEEAGRALLRLRPDEA